MAKFKGAELVCQICGAQFKVPKCRETTATTCSKACSVKYRAQGLMREKVALVCKACGVTYFAHKSQSVGRVYCSYTCKDNHQAYKDAAAERVVGDKNGHWKGGIVDHSDGYKYEACHGHPFSQNNYVLQHRLVVERHLIKTNPASKCLVKLGENLYLDPELDVHHKNFDKVDNHIDNLEVMTKGDHRRLHNLLRRKT